MCTIQTKNNQGECITSLLGYNGPVRFLVFIHSDEDEHEFLSELHDQNKNNVESLITCKGYHGTMEILALQKNIFCIRFF